MKLSTRKIVGIELVAVALMVVMTLTMKTAWLRSWLQVAVLGAAVAAGIGLLGWAKVQSRNCRNVVIAVLLGAVLFQAVRFVFLGLKLGFVQNVFVWKWDTFWIVFLPMIFAIVLQEIWRGQMIQKGKTNQKLIVLTTVVLISVQLLIELPAYDLSVGKDVFDFIVIIGLPVCLANILFSFVAYRYDYKINIGYRLIMEMPIYVLPIWPDASQYLSMIFEIALVFVLIVALVGFRHKFEVKKKDKMKRAESGAKMAWKRVLGWGVAGVAIFAMLVYVALMSGLFKYHLLAIGSGSMEPYIAKGDMVLVEKSDKYDEMTEGEVLVYRHENVVMVHRINEVTEQNGVFTFKTKGDANDAVDKWVVNQGDIVGIAKGKIKAFGFPTLWLNELFNGGKS